MISTNIIIIWPGTNATIPSGYTRETTLDNKYPKASGAESPNTTGGSDTHTHTSDSHTHTLTGHSHAVVLTHVSGPQEGQDGAGDAQDNHGHVSANVSGASGGSLQGQVVTWGSVNSEPPYYTVIFIKATGNRPIPPNSIILWNSSTLPSGFNVCNGDGGLTPDLKNKYLKGADTGADGGSTGGALAHQHVITHSHTADAHTHSGSSGSPDSTAARISTSPIQNGARFGHLHTISLDATTDSVANYVNTTAGSTDTVEPAYKKLAAIRNISGINKIPAKEVIALWLGTVATIPVGWRLCDGTLGTPNLTDKFIKVINTVSEIGNTGGVNTHSHSSVSHTHTGASTHTHTGSTGGPDTTTQVQGNTTGVTKADHTHPLTSVSSITTAYSTDNVTSGVAANNQPAYRTVAYIMLKNPPSGMIQED